MDKILSKEELVDSITNSIIDSNDTHREYDTDWSLKIRCPICGDSETNPNAMHHYVKLGNANDFPLAFKCYKPGCKSGILTSKELNKYYGIKDPIILKSIDYYNNEVGVINTDKDFNDITVQLEYNKIPESNLIIDKYVSQYFMNRTGIKLTYSFIKKYRLVTDVKQFMESLSSEDRNIATVKLLYVMVNKFHKNYIGFFNERFDMVQFRNINPNDDKDKRFIKVSLTQLKSDTQHSSFVYHEYELNTDMFEVYKRHNIYMSEGTFDIINIKEHIKHNTPGSYYNTGGINGMLKIINTLVKYDYNINLIIYSDSDIDYQFYKKIYNIIKPRLNNKLGCGLIVCYNNIYKDYGDINHLDINQIKELMF